MTALASLGIYPYDTGSRKGCGVAKRSEQGITRKRALAEYQPGVLRPGVPRPDDPSDPKELKALLKATIANAKLADETGVMVHKDAHTGETSEQPSVGFTTEWTLNGTPVRAVHTYVFGPVQTWSMSMMAPVAEWPEVEAGFRELMNSFRPG